MSPRAFPRWPAPATLGNAAVLVALAATAAWLLGLHARPWFVPVSQPLHWGLAAFATLAYAAFTAWTWRRPGDGAPRARAGAAGEAVLVAYASQTGFAVDLAQRTAASLREAWGLGG